MITAAANCSILPLVYPFLRFVDKVLAWPMAVIHQCSFPCQSYAQPPAMECRPWQQRQYCSTASSLLKRRRRPHFASFERHPIRGRQTVSGRRHIHPAPRHLLAEVRWPILWVDFVQPLAVCTFAAEKLAVNADFFVPPSHVRFNGLDSIPTYGTSLTHLR
uniref:G_PROTEIN_RECEP_F1_2 domain-containing protein n=1 Tax=Panagrellus redivivus TaxID=6233 RepID=A0A7E4W3D8_PANRE